MPTASALALLMLAASLPEQSAQAATQTWQNAGTDFNSAGSWLSGVPGPGDVARFNSAMGTQPNLSASLTIQELNFSAATSSGYDLTSSNTSIKLTLTNIGIGAASAINAANTSGTNTIDAPLILGAAAGSTQTFTQAAGGTLVVKGVISNTNNVTLAKAGAGTLTLSGANTYSGGTTINAGTLNINNASALGTGTFTIASGSNAVIDNTSGGAITLSTNNAQVWNGNFTFTGTQSLNLGTGAVTLGASRTVTVNGSNLTVGGVIGGTGFKLTKAGTGTLTLSGANTYSGGTTIGTGTSAGTLNINNASALGTGTFTIAASSNAIIDNTTGSAITLSTNNAQVWNGNFTFTGTQSLNLGTGAVTLGASRTVTVNGSTLTVGGVISGSGFGLTKAGVGTLVLSGANTYTGATAVNAGTLNVNGSLASGSAVTVSNSGTVLGGTGTINGSVSIASSGAILQGGTGSTGQTLTMTGAVTMSSGSIIQLALGPSLAHSTLAISGLGSLSFATNQDFKFIDLGATTGTYTGLITGVPNPGASTLNSWVIDNSGWAGSFSWDAANGGEIDLNLTAAPEPSTWITGAFTALFVAYSQRRRLSRLLISNC